jgi:hypothetical protein
MIAKIEEVGQNRKGAAPWIEHPYRLVSWLDMEKFSAASYFTLGQGIQQIRDGLENQPDKGVGLRESLSPALKTALNEIGIQCKAVALKVTEQLCIELLNSLDKVLSEGKLHDALDHISQTIAIEMNQNLFMYIPSVQSEFYDQPEMFGKYVNTKFPTVQYDLVEAGNCLATGRSTAVVFHLMRIMEVGVQQFGTKLGVKLADEKNWQNILDEVNTAIKALPKTPQRAEMSQASANLYAVKLAWRNEVMHPNDKYTLEEAENLVRQVKIFMEKLATIV